MRIDQLGLSKTAENALKRAGIVKVKDLKRCIRQGNLRDLQGLGEKSYNEIIQYIVSDWEAQDQQQQHLTQLQEFTKAAMQGLSANPEMDGVTITALADMAISQAQETLKLMEELS